MATDTGSSPGDRIVALVREALGGSPATDVVRLTSGASRETWTCVVDAKLVVVQRQRPDDVKDMSIEAGVVRAAHAAGVPAPELLAFVDADEAGVAAMVTRHVEGETIARKILRDDTYSAARHDLAGQLGRALARLHRIDVADTPGLVHTDPIEALRDRLDQLGEPHPAFELAFKWLAGHRPPSTGPTGPEREPIGELRPIVTGEPCGMKSSEATSPLGSLVHGDFRLGNVIVDGDGLQAVIDWELAHIGDPMEDLGWLCSPAWRFGSQLPAAGVGTRQQLFDAYGDEAGIVVDPEIVRWWEISGILRWGMIGVTQAHAHTSGAVRSHELAAIGRRVCETEHDLFLAIEGRWTL